MSTENIHYLSTSSTSSISSISTDDIHILSTYPASSISTSPNTNVLSSSSSSNSLSYSGERICYLLKYEKQQHDIIDNRASSATALYWSIFGFPAKELLDLQVAANVKKTFVYGPHSGTNNMKQHPCVIIVHRKILIQTSINNIISMKIDMDNYSSNDLTFWKSNTDELPLLSKLARQVYSIPATNAGIERQFSIAGITLTDRSTSLDLEQLDNMLYICAVEKLDSQM